MIIYPAAFVLSAEAASESLRFSRIGYQTYTFALDTTAVIASTEIAAGPKDAPLRPDTAEYWEPSALPATWQLNFGTTRNIDYVGLLGSFGTNGVSALIETSDLIEVGSPPAAVWTTFAAAVAPTNDDPILYLDDVVAAAAIRVTLTGSGSMPRMAVVYVGEALVMQREVTAPFTPPNLSRKTVLSRSLSRGGEFLGQGFRRMGVESSASFQLLEPAWYRANFDPFVKHARSLPYFFAWLPEDYTTEVAFAWSPDDIRPSYQGVWNYMQVSWQMVGIGNE